MTLLVSMVIVGFAVIWVVTWAAIFVIGTIERAVDMMFGGS